MPSRPTVQARMGCEILEDRLALSAGTTVPVPWSATKLSPPRPSTVTTTLQNGLLTVLGTPGRDVITMRPAPGRLVVAGKSFATRKVKRVVIAAEDGGDLVWVGNGVSQPCRIFGGKGNDILHGGAGDDEIYGDGGRDSLLGGPGNDVIYGGRDPDLIAGCAGVNQTFEGEPYRAGTPSPLAVQIATLINGERARQGVSPLSLDARLVRAASLQAGNMARRSNLVGPDEALQHTVPGAAQPTLSSRLDYVGYAFEVAAENIAYGYTSAADVVAGWMTSSDHRDNILSPTFTAIGIGVQADAGGRLFFSQVFATPRGATAE